MSFLLMLALWLVQAPEPVLEPVLLGGPAPSADATTLVVRALREPPGAPPVSAWPKPEERDWLFVRSGGGQENVEHAEPVPDEPAVRLPRPATSAPVAVIGLDLRPRLVEVPAARLRAFARAHGLTGELPATGIVRLRRVESAKRIVRFGGTRPSSSALTKTGQTAELRALFDPTVAAPGSALAFRVYLPGGSAGAHVVARHPASATRNLLVADPSGSVSFPCTHAGRWIVEAHGLRAPDDGSAELELTSATLVFEVGGPR